MNDNYRFAPVLEEIEFLTAERKQITSSGPHLSGLYTLTEKGRKRIVSICLVHRSRPFPIKLSRRGRIFVDFLAKHKHLLLTAAEIEAGIDEFYAENGNRSRRSGQKHILPRRMVKVYAQRAKGALGRAFHAAGLNANPYRVLLSEPSETNQTLYRLKCTFEERQDRPKQKAIQTSVPPTLHGTVRI
jgi:hypothetical protein